MRTILEMRVGEEFARRYLRAGEGRVLGSAISREIIGATVRELKVEVGTDRYWEVGSIYKRLRKQTGEYLFHGWDIRRVYSRAEIHGTQLLLVRLSRYFEPAGEQCGTAYDESVACTYCGTGRRQDSDLVLDLRRVPKRCDIATTIAEEWIISQRLAEILTDAGMTGFALRPVHHKARYEDDPFHYERTPSGREMLAKARAQGIEPGTIEYYIWINRPERQELCDRAEAEIVEIRERLAWKRKRLLPVWYQFNVTSTPVGIVAQTQFGTGPFDNDEDKARCPLGHVLGLNILSELYVKSADWDGSDMAITRELAGHRMGVLVPSPFLLISQRLYQLLKAHNIKGFNVEVAHLV